MSTSIAADAGLFEMLNGIPNVDIPRNLQAAISAGGRMTSILREVVSLRRAPGKLTPNEYFYYRLWDPALSAAEKRRFAGKQAEHQMHLACNDSGWYAAAADKLLFQILMAGSMFPVPPLLAVTQAGREPGKRAPSGTLPKSCGSCESRRFTRCSPNRSPGNTVSPS
jgi:hypothetical protein